MSVKSVKQCFFLLKILHTNFIVFRLQKKKRFKTFPHIWATLVSKHRSMHCTAAVGVRFRPGWLSRFEMQISHGYKLL